MCNFTNSNDPETVGQPHRINFMIVVVVVVVVVVSQQYSNSSISNMT